MSVVTFEKLKEFIGLVKINRPEALNALNLEVRSELSKPLIHLLTTMI